VSARTSLDEPAGTQLSGAAVRAALLRYGACIAVAGVLFGAIAYGVSKALPVTFTAGSQLVLGNPGDVTVFSTSNAVNPVALSLGAAEVLRSKEVSDRANQLLRAKHVAASVSGHLTVTPATNSPVVAIDATAKTAASAQAVANAVAQAYLDVTKEQYAARGTKAHHVLDGVRADLQKQLTSVQKQLAERVTAADYFAYAAAITPPVDRARFIQSTLTSDSTYQSLLNRSTTLSTGISNALDEMNQSDVDSALLQAGVDRVIPAQRPSNETSPDTTRNVGIGVVLGALIGAALAWRSNQRRRVIDPIQAAACLGAPLLGRVGRDRRLRTLGAFVDFSTDSPLGNELKVLTSSVVLNAQRRGLNAVVITSAHSREGKSVLASNIAAAGEFTGHSTVLVDADARGGAISQALGLPDNARLDGLLSHGSRGNAIAAVPYGQGRAVAVIPVGAQDWSDGLARALSTESSITWASTLSAAGAVPSAVAIVDTPPMNEDPLALQLAQDAALIVVISASTTVTDLEVIRNRAQMSGVPVLGFVINDYSAPRLRRRIPPASPVAHSSSVGLTPTPAITERVESRDVTLRDQATAAKPSS
jgi:capsular polysaccharide biosynthesis protein/Mrp family chromosome partitioning ATPase